MSRVLTCGFELTTSTTTGLEALGVQFVGPPTISSTVSRSGRNSLRSLAAGLQRYAQWAFDSTLTTQVFVRVYVLVVTLPDVAAAIVTVPRTRAKIILNPNGTLDVAESTWQTGADSVTAAGIFTATLSQWFCLEISSNGTTSALAVRVNQASAYSGTLGTIDSLYITLDIGFGITNALPTVGEVYVDDVAVNDTNGSAQNSWCGAGSVVYARVIGDGDADIGTVSRAGTDTGSNWGQLAETTPDDVTTYLILAAANDEVIVSVTHPDVLGITRRDAITLVEVHGRIAGATSGTGNWFPQIMSVAGGSKLAGTTTTLASAAFNTDDDTTGAQGAKLVSYTDPQLGGAWTFDLLQTLQITATTSDANPDTYVSNLWAIIEFVPAALDKIYRRMVPTQRNDATSF